MTTLKRKADRVAYYLRNIGRDLAPRALFRATLEAHLRRDSGANQDALAERLNYFSQLAKPFQVSDRALTIDKIPLKSSFYYYDFKEHLRYFDSRYRVDYLFGDIITVPPVPTFVKSRPIGGDNANSILVNLDKFRHFHRVRDTIPFKDKKPVVVWRGISNNPKRLALVKEAFGRPGFDVGFAGGTVIEEYRRPTLSIEKQLANRYIVSVEGNDVATNLKWIMSSNSLCIMPAPRYETWFMEGTLRSGVHYVEVGPDFSDLEETVEYYEAHPNEAEAIVRNANAYIGHFFHPRTERLLSLLVFYRYFVLSGQMQPITGLPTFVQPFP